MIARLVDAAGFDTERGDGLVTATHEAAMNALRHAGGGVVRAVHSDGAVQVWIEDTGRGIALDKLPKNAVTNPISPKAPIAMDAEVLFRNFAERMQTKYGTYEE